jgi:hypothetical protein
MEILRLEPKLRAILIRENRHNYELRTILAIGLGCSVVFHWGLLRGIAYWWQPVSLDDSMMDRVRQISGVKLAIATKR